MPSLRPLQSVLPDAAQQAEFARQLDVLVNQFKSYPSIAIWVCWSEIKKEDETLKHLAGHLQRGLGPDH